MEPEQSEIEKIKLRVDDATLSSSGSACPKCGLELAPGLTVCPNDGHQMMPDYKPGSKIGGKYNFIEPLGMGGMSSVYKATDQMLDRVVAVKMLHSHLAQNESMLKRFRQEGRAISQLNHPNIVRVLEFGVLDQGQPYIVTDYIHGESLELMIKRGGPLPPDRALPVFKQIIQALDHAHARGVLHRDLKPSNVMISVGENGQPLATLVDFGIAKVTAGDEAARLTATGEVFGSPMYMSPEQAKGMDVDARSDLYSLGCLMHETLSGKPLFEGSNPLEVIFQKLNKEPASLRDDPAVPQSLSAIIDRLLQTDPDNRYQTAEAVLADLDHQQSTVSPVRVSIQTSARKPVSDDIFAKLSTPKGLLVVAIVMAISLIAVGQLKSLLVSDAVPDAVTTSGSATDKMIKATLSDLETKESIDLSKTDLTDLGLQWLGKAPKLRSVNLNSTKITTIAPLAGLPLRELWLRDDAITDAGMRAIGSFSELQTLDLANTKITDNTAAQLSGLKQLQVLGVDNTQVTDAFLTPLPDGLKWLSLNGTKVTNKALDQLTRFTQLEGVTLDGMTVDGKTTELLVRMPQLQQLYLRSESIDDKTAEALTQLKNLRELSLAGGKLTAQSLLALSTLENLELLALDSSNLDNSAVPLLSTFKRLTKVRLSGNPITDNSIDALNMAEHLQELDLSDTAITAPGLLKLNGPKLGLKRLRIHGIKLTPEQLQKLQSQNLNTVIETN